MLKRVGLLCSLFCFLLSVGARSVSAQEVEKPARILFLLDASGSMRYAWQDDTSRFDAAAMAILRIVDSIYAINPDVAFALRVFGAEFPASAAHCYDSKMEVPFAYQNRAQIAARLKYLYPKGYSPIAWSLEQAAENDFERDDRYAYSIILITDGGESCGGDICATVENLIAKKISFKPYVLSMIDPEDYKAQYDCFATLLQITNVSELDSAVQEILKNNRRVLRVRRPVLRTAPVREVPAARTPSPTPRKMESPEPAKPVSVKPAEEPHPEQPVTQEWVKPARISVARLAPIATLTPMRLLYAFPAIKPARMPRLPVMKWPDSPPQVATEKPTPVPRQEAKPERANPPSPPARKGDSTVDYFVDQQDAAKTTVLVYFTDGKGTFYRTEPLMHFLDARTQKPVKDAYRNMAGAEPVPIELTPGNYDIVIPGSEARAANVAVAANKTTKVYIRAGRGSLAFYYPTAPDRPVKEYMALVSKRFEDGPVVKHPCDEVLEYDPTNYHIEINTLPPLIYNIDLNFNQTKVVAVPEPGTIRILNTENLGRVQFWRELGNRFVPFFEMNVHGDVAAQEAEFLPGRYQVRYYKQPRLPHQNAEVVMLSIKSNQTTELQLTP